MNSSNAQSQSTTKVPTTSPYHEAGYTASTIVPQPTPPISFAAPVYSPHCVDSSDAAKVSGRFSCKPANHHSHGSSLVEVLDAERSRSPALGVHRCSSHEISVCHVLRPRAVYPTT
ncbi:hypothetical protein N658DRAFT_493294 [Parathielavia hyrcaniae]|uniref:Uncharacterized protein n=1 Tax=Parathielavia hyrcaniae TaxID=113614 RepID=A0AAN6T3V5_9PEZI|nr:hypothetical protein N658DRAFT_493294 [Parathielavia hyrcaniae]